MARRQKGTRLSVFTGREAKLNRAIFHALADTGPLTIYDVHKHVKTRRGLTYTKYASVNKRVRTLAEAGYLRPIGVTTTKAGFAAALYELTARTYLALVLDDLNFEQLVGAVGEDEAFALLGDLLCSKCTRAA